MVSIVVLGMVDLMVGEAREGEGDRESSRKTKVFSSAVNSGSVVGENKEAEGSNGLGGHLVQLLLHFPIFWIFC